MTFTKEKHRKEKPCLFCRWAKVLDKLEKKEIAKRKLAKKDREWHSYQYLGKSENFFAVLDRCPRVIGHTMIILREFNPSHYTDIADPRLSKFRPTEEDFNFIERIVRKLKKLTDDKEHAKIYLMSICEHWEPEELAGKPPTEHLHFHLLPRHKDARTKYPHFVPEHIFIRCQDMDFPLKRLGKIKKEILKN